MDDPVVSDPGTPFARALRAAVARRGLPLQRLSSRLAERGLPLSPATLSHWQRGRSQPERGDSLAALTALESILGLDEGELSGLLGPQRPRGRSVTPPESPAVLRRLYGTGSTQEAALGGAAFREFNTGLRALTVRDTLVLDESRCVRRVLVQQVVRASRPGVDRLTVVHEVDDPRSLPVDVHVRCGRLGEVRCDPAVSCAVVEVLFGRPLRVSETAIVEYELAIDDCRTPSLFHERSVRPGLRELLLHVRFHPAALPLRCHRYHRPAADGPRGRLRRVELDASHTAHLLPGRCTVGFHGLAWQWPR
ncbi:hypothetical protein H3146_12575 [Streptomyces sp. OF3]|uniref:Uncharacterized protein n=1 Tax=Streptomyces alkaliterrae TaxID=2213162 RepID=A0A7W3WKY0_9ACTN|nr:hypothetical protein [Streptomyces alkaliterrae]MBB1254197.1 hypothetical protein [Streptomyces alkaliterrae]